MNADANELDDLTDRLAGILADRPDSIPRVLDALRRAVHLRYARRSLEQMPERDEP